MSKTTSGQLAHFAINADDVDRARAFYGDVFGWRFVPFGPPNFFQIETTDDGDAPVRGALQQRREIVEGVRQSGFECTLSVPDVDAAAAAIEKAGGRVVMPKATIAGVGHLIFFEDPEGNIVGAMQYDFAAE